MISNKNVRIIITISKKQYKWIEEFSNKKHLSKSKLISWLLAKKTEDVKSTLKLNTNPKEEVAKITEEEYTDEQFNKDMKDLEELKRRAKNENIATN